MRYRSGSLIIPNEDDEQSSSQRSLIATLTDISVSEVRQRCTSDERCVSFSFRSDQTRFPSKNVTAFLFGHADWHVELAEDSPVSVVNTAFVDDIRYHTYVNTTREKTAVTREVGSLIKLLMKTEISEESVTSEEPPNNNSNKSRLRARGRNTAANDVDPSKSITNQKLMVLQAIFDIVYNKELRLLAAPLVVPWALSLGSSDTEPDEVRENALTILMVIADGTDCLPVMMQHGVFSSMKSIISEQQGKDTEEWSHICKLSLDVISNIAIHQAVNEDLRREGAVSFLQKLISRPGFPGLQATMALTHLSDKLEFGVINQLPPERLDDLVNLMRAAIDGDIAYENKWDLVPGPLSSIKYLVYQSNNSANSWVCDRLLKAGLMEQLLRVLEADCLDAIDIETALEALWGLSGVSEEGRHMIVMAEHSIHEAGKRLARYDKASKLAYGLVDSAMANFNTGGSEL